MIEATLSKKAPNEFVELEDDAALKRRLAFLESITVWKRTEKDSNGKVYPVTRYKPMFSNYIGVPGGFATVNDLIPRVVR